MTVHSVRCNLALTAVSYWISSEREQLATHATTVTTKRGVEIAIRRLNRRCFIAKTYEPSPVESHRGTFLIRMGFAPSALDRRHDLGYTDCAAMTEKPPDSASAPAPESANADTFLPDSTVLIVDDNPQNVELLQAFLESLPLKIITAADGVDALENVRQHNPDLILLDVMMPRMSGFQVCKQLKSDPKTKDIQVLMVTALNELGDIEQASECGTDDFVSKPINKLELITRVKSLLRVRHMKSELERALSYLNEIEHDDEVI